MKLFIYSIACILLASCGGGEETVWSKQMWLAPLLTGIGAVIFWVSAYRSSKSGSKQQLPGGGYTESDKNVPIYKTWQFIFASVLTIATIAIIISVNSSK